MARGSERPPWWAVVVIVVGLVLLIVGLPFALNRGGEPLSKAELGRLEVAARSADAADAVAPTRILAIGDSYTGGSDQGGTGAMGWPRLVGEDLTTAGYKVQVDVSAAGGSGYVTVGPTGKTLVDLAHDAAAGSAYDLVIFFGSRNDTAPKAQVQAAAAAAFAAMRTAAPNAKMLVIGPPWVDSDPPANILADRDAVSAAASQVQATFVDPLRDDWFGGQYSALIGSDGVHPTNDGHRHMADLITPQLEQILGKPQS